MMLKRRGVRRRASIGTAAVAGAVVIALAAPLTGCSNSGDVDSIDPRVLNGVVQRAGGEGYADMQWVHDGLRARILPEVESCLRERGRDDVDAESMLARFDEMHWTEFPPVSLYRDKGIVPPQYREGLTEEQSAQEQQVIECRGEVLRGSEGKVAGLIEDLSEQWITEYSEQIAREDFGTEFTALEACLREKTGYPGDTPDEGGQPDVYGFSSWWPNQHGGESMSEQDNLEGGRIFADCLDPYLEAQARATDDLRDSFIQEHLGELTTINNELTR